MNEEKSAIDSFSVSLGPSSKGAPIPRGKQLEAWNILVCSDLGFSSEKPRRISIAEWNEYMASCTIVLSGTIEPNASNEKPLYLEYAVSSMKDFSAEAMKTAINPAGKALTLEVLTQLLNGKIAVKEAIAALEAGALPDDEKRRVMALLYPAGAGQKKPKTSSGPLSTVLSMVDIGAPASEDLPSASPLTATEALAVSLSGGNGDQIDKNGIAAYIEMENKKMRERSAALQATPFFSSRKASWQCLYHCAKLLGRNKEVRLHAFSAPYDGMLEALGGVLSGFADAGAPPDLILWDFDTAFTHANLVQLAAVAEAADRYKSMVIAPLPMDDPLLTGLKQKDTLIPILQETRFLPMKKLRENAASRCLCLCGPDMVLSEDGGVGPRKTSLIARGCWPALIRWIELLIVGQDPFAVREPDAPAESSLDGVAQFCQAVPRHLRIEASAAGLTLFEGALKSATLDRAVTMIDPSVAGDLYCSFTFNFLVDRVARLSALRLLSHGPSESNEAVAGDLRQFLHKELSACGICASPDQASVIAKTDGTVEIEIKSDVTVGGIPARFVFSLER